MKKYSFVFIYIVMMAIPSAVLLFFTHDLVDINALLVLILISLLIGGLLEIISVKQGKKDKFYIWEYNSKTTLDKKVLGVAVEDMILFLILTPIFVVTAWEAIKKIMSTYQFSLPVVLLGGLLVVAASYFITYKITKPK